MIIRRLHLENFRNYAQADIEWHQEINLLTGLNAQGKSNLLEAVCCLSLTASFRAASEQELLKWDAPHFYVEGIIAGAGQGDFSISMAYDRAKNKRWRLDGQMQARKSDLVGRFHTVIFSPEDVDLVKAGPAERRRFLNRQISQLYPEHCRHLLRYNKVLAQRNSLLRQAAPADALQIWDQQLAQLGAAIIMRRRQVLAQLTPLAAELHARLSGGERLSLRYKSLPGAAEIATATKDLDASSLSQLEEIFHAELSRLRLPEQARGATLCGPHRDDIIIEIEGSAAKLYASQGQQRTAALALKLAELELAREQKGEWPVLLLDDVLSELDEKRRAGLLQHISGQTQTIITSTDSSLPLPVGQVWKIKNGTIIKA